MDIESIKQTALAVLVDPPPVTNKLSALDALDRLALDPSGWFPDRVLNRLTDARVGIIVDRWGDALRALEDAEAAMSQFIEAVSKGPEHHQGMSRDEAVERAKQELSQCQLATEWVRNSKKAA